MVKLNKIYTRTGDDGTTALGFGGRVDKDDLRVECYGTVDELNACLGVVRAAGSPPDLDRELARIQNELFHLGSDLCVPERDKESHPVPRIETRHVEALEKAIYSKRNFGTDPIIESEIQELRAKVGEAS